MAKPTIYVIDDDPDVRQSLQWLVHAMCLAPVQTYACAEDFLAEYRPEWAGCIVLDVQLPGMDGLELLARLESLGPHPPVLMLTAYGDIPMAVQALKAGAYDFIEKPYNDGDLVEHLRKALESDETLRSQRHERAQLMELFALLTDREWEVMRRLVEGQTSKRIAEDLGIGERTVETHRQRIMHKLEVDSVADLVRLASRLLDHP